MASSGVWENVFLSKTLTLDGVCKMLWFIIFGWICMPKCDLLVIFAEFFSQTFCIDLCDRC